MPFLYTHIRFATKCIGVLPLEYKTIVENNLNYFYYGALGPNILHYHSPLTNRKYKDTSDEIHSNQLAIHLKRIKEDFIKNKNRDAILSYSLGYISHFILDTYLNPYLNKSSNVLKINIELIKNEIEKYYINKDSINIQKILNDIKKLPINYSIISKELNIGINSTKQSISNMYQYSNILYIKNKSIISIFKLFLKLLNKQSFSNCFVYGSNNKLTSQIIRCEKYFEIAIYHYQILLSNFVNYIYNDEPLDDYFYNSFNNNQKDIPIFNIEEEKKYIITELFN